MKKSTFSVRVLAEIAIFAALAFALDMLQAGYSRALFVNGGSIGIAMVPIFVISFRRGLLPGVICGLVVSLLQMLAGGPYVINASNYEGAMQVFSPMFQIMLDYLLGYTLVGFAGVFAKAFMKSETKIKQSLFVVAGVILGGTLKFMAHFLSGVFFWLDPSIDFFGINGGSWVYSLVYNGLACFPSIILCAVVMVIIVIVYPVFLTDKELENTKNKEVDEVKEDKENVKGTN